MTLPSSHTISPALRRSLWLAVVGLMAGGTQSGCQSTSLVSFPVQKRPMSAFFKDQRIRLAINRSLSGQYTGSVTLLILQGRVWVIGCVSTQEEKKVVTSLIQCVTNVTEVVDFLYVASCADNAVKDTYLSQKFQSTLFFDSRIRSQNYHVTVFNRVLYILGIASSEEEKKMVIDHASTMKLANLMTDIAVTSAAP